MAETVLPAVDISVENDQWTGKAAIRDCILRAVGAATEVAGLRYPDNAELSIVLTDDTAMRKLNREWRAIDKPTNVLSFPADDLKPGQAAGRLLGDIIIAHDTIVREAAEERKNFQDHFIHLVIHGFLHLFGYDHQNDIDADIMENIESEALARLDIADPYDARDPRIVN